MSYARTFYHAYTLDRALGTIPGVLFCKLLLTVILKKLFGRSARVVTFIIQGRSYPFALRDAADIAALYEVFVEREYELPALAPRTIVDLGGHIGATALYFHTRYPNAHIVVYEPDPGNFALLDQNVVPHGITCINAAVAGESGSRTFFSAKSSIASSLIERPGTRAAKTATRSLDDIIAEHQPDLLKFDIEGAEAEVFAAAQTIKRCPNYVGELHYDLIKQTLKDFSDHFPGFVLSERRISPNRAIVSLHL